MKRIWFLLTDGLPRLGLRLLDDLRSRGRRCEWCDWFHAKDQVCGICTNMQHQTQVMNRQDWCKLFKETS